MTEQSYVEGSWNIHDDEEMSEHSSYGSCEGQGPPPSVRERVEQWSTRRSPPPTSIVRSHSSLGLTSLKSSVGIRRQRSVRSKLVRMPQRSEITVEDANRALEHVHSQHEIVHSKLEGLAGDVAQMKEEHTSEMAKVAEVGEQSTSAVAHAQHLLTESSAIRDHLTSTLQQTEAVQAETKSIAECAKQSSDAALQRTDQISQTQAAELEHLKDAQSRVRSMAEFATKGSHDALEKAKQVEWSNIKAIKEVEQRLSLYFRQPH